MARSTGALRARTIRNGFGWTLRAAALGALAIACGSDEDPGGAAAVCTTGETRSCVGPGACQGGQSCLADGTGFGECDCGAATGGSAGSLGGASGSGASGGTGGSSGVGGTTAGSGGSLGGAGGSSGSTASGGIGGAGSGGVAGAAGGSAGTSGGAGSSGASGASGAGGIGGGAGAAGSGGTGGLPAQCAGKPGPAMVNMGGWCIDSTEVTRAQYDIFLQAKGSDTSGQIAACATNTSYQPVASCGTYDPATYPNRPVGCIHWCDAYAYCAWAGKRLCGKIGGGYLSTQAQTIDPALSQWAYACSNGGTTKYPYGNVANIPLCDTADGFSSDPVATHPECHGLAPPFSEVWDLVDNVAEYVDVRTVIGVNEFIDETRVGYFGTLAAYGCESFEPASAGPTHWTGFRCCVD